MQNVERTSLLLIEDDINDAVLFKEQLNEVSENEFHVVHVRSIEEARNFLNAIKFQNIILDLSLSDSKGIDTVKAIRSECPDTPIVVLTGTDSEELASFALHEGAQDYLVKGRGDGHLLKKAIKYAKERQKLENEIFRLACYDEVTGLINGRYFMERLERAVLRGSRYKTKLVLIYIDIINFKNINERFGHTAGNLILKQIAESFKENVRETDIIARVRSDDFCFVHEQLSENYQEECELITKNLYNCITDRTFYFQNHPIKISFNAGIAVYPEVANTAVGLLDKADRAMYFSRKSEKTFFHYAVPDSFESEYIEINNDW